MLKIERIDDFKYKIENNPFYPDGKGGQLGDKGEVGEAFIKGTFEDYVILDRNLESGYYNYKIYKKRREDIRAQHTAQHIFSAIAYKKYSLNTVGFRMAEDYTTVDLDKKDISEEIIEELENLVNKAIKDDIQIEEIVYSNEEAHKFENLRKKVKDKIKGDVRFIKISDIDICACAGFHVSKTSEIKIFKILSYENIKGNFTRFYFLAGERALNDYKLKHQIIKKMTSRFSCKTNEILEMLNKSLFEKEKLSQDLKNITHRYSGVLSKELEKKYVEYKGIKIILYNEDKNVADILGKFINIDKFLLVSGYEKNYMIMSNKVDCQKLIKDICRNFPNIKGGGSLKKGNIKLDKNYKKDEFFEILKNSIL